MFTGLIEEIGTIKSLTPFGGGLKIVISASEIPGDCSVGDSINVNGACQTVTSLGKGFFEVTAVTETVKKTTLGKLRLNERVNLERSLTLNKKLGGHFVMGHVDTTGKIMNIRKLPDSYLVDISYPKEFGKYIVNVGAISVDGISLTIASFAETVFTVSVIPHTWSNTVLADRSAGSMVNLEFDILGKYVARMLGREESTGLTEEWLKQQGF